jgi:hypothetical protein
LFRLVNDISHCYFRFLKEQRRQEAKIELKMRYLLLDRTLAFFNVTALLKSTLGLVPAINPAS